MIEFRGYEGLPECRPPHSKLRELKKDNLDQDEKTLIVFSS